MRSIRASGVVRTAVRLLALVVLVEGGSRLVLWLGEARFPEIRPTRVIYGEQTAGISKLIASETDRLLVLDSTLGWRYRSGYRDSLNATNAEGLRSRREYSPAPAAGVVRVAAFGDSFVYSNEVADENAWPRIIEHLHPGTEVLNYGVGGYGVDQAYLRYLSEGRRLCPHLVLVGFAPDDLSRVVNVYRRFRSNHEIPLVKPRFLLRGTDSLLLLPSPIRSARDYEPYLKNPRRITELGRHDAWYEPAVYRNPVYDYSAAVQLVTEIWVRARHRLGPGQLIRRTGFNPESEAFRIQILLFQRFAEAVRRSGARPLILFLPDREVVSAVRQHDPSVFEPLKNALAVRNLEYLDASDAFQVAPQEHPDDWFMPGGHYSPAGNRVVARWLGPKLAVFQPAGAIAAGQARGQ